MKIQEAFKVEFHPDVATAVYELAQEVLKCVHSFERVDTPPTRGAEIHPVASLTADDIIGEVMVRVLLSTDWVRKLDVIGTRKAFALDGRGANSKTLKT